MVKEMGEDIIVYNYPRESALNSTNMTLAKAGKNYFERLNNEKYRNTFRGK